MRIFYLFLLFSVIVPGLIQAGEREKVAVLDFKAIMTPPEMGLAVAEILRTELISLGGYIVLERGALEQVMQEQSLQLTGSVDPETAVMIGRLLGAQVVISGSIVKIGAVYTINSRFIEVETGIVRIGGNIRGEGVDQISDMLQQLAINVKETLAATIPLLQSFEYEAETLPIWLTADERKSRLVTIQRSDEQATNGKYSMKVRFPAGDYPGIQNAGYPRDWSGYRQFSLDIINLKEKKLIMAMRMDDDNSTGFNSQFNFPFELVPGVNSLTIDVSRIGDCLDLTKISLLVFYLVEPNRKYTLYFDNFRLTP